MQVNNSTKGRTEVINNSEPPCVSVIVTLTVSLDLNPVWEQFVYIPGWNFLDTFSESYLLIWQSTH